MSPGDRILLALASGPFSSYTVSELAGKAGLARSTVYRYLSKLEGVRETSFGGVWALDPAHDERVAKMADYYGRLDECRIEVRRALPKQAA